MLSPFAFDPTKICAVVCSIISYSNVPSQTQIVSGEVDFLFIIGELPCLQNIFLNSTDNFENYLTTKTTTLIYKFFFLSSILTEKYCSN